VGFISGIVDKRNWELLGTFVKRRFCRSYFFNDDNGCNLILLLLKHKSDNFGAFCTNPINGTKHKSVK
jgi:hypothetical protein